MERAAVLDVLRDTAVARLEVQPEQIHEAASFADLEVDSLALVELTVDLEEVFQVDLLEVLGGLPTVGAFVDAICAAVTRNPEA